MFVVHCSCRPVHNTKSVSVCIINTSFWLVHGDLRGPRTGVCRGATCFVAVALVTVDRM